MIKYRGYTVKHHKHHGLGVFYNDRLVTLASQPIQWIDLDIDYFNSRNKF
jgi:hypothetical protein